ncbi:putative acyl-CoA dehydrogenase IBR3 [Trichoderma ghanense]|uniref:Acyl-CoA dehydrogenase IBR3 n=1 Tax=Trichoderma ghanense TaxID=65468 RepID=A0ABY2HDG5_9HYPO
MAGAVRQPIDEKALAKYIDDNVPIIKTPIDLKQFGFGQSNPTYQITDATGQRYVLRKKPPGKLLSKTAHKVEREYRVLHALEATDVAVPKTFCLCEDESVVGTPFYIMEFLDGRIFEDFLMPGVSPEERTALWREAVQTLARLHAVDVKQVGLEKFGRAEGFYARQTETWATICESQAKAVDVETGEPVGQLPHFEELVGFFRDERLRPRDRATLVHGDYKIDNLVFDRKEAKVIGILDWEMSTIGHPLSDICNLITQFYLARSPGASAYADSANFLPGRTPGLPQPDQIVQWYTDVSGYDPRPELGWGAAFNIFKLAGEQRQGEDVHPHEGAAGRVCVGAGEGGEGCEGGGGEVVMGSAGFFKTSQLLLYILPIPPPSSNPHMPDRRRRIRVSEDAPDERRPLLSRLSTERAANGEHVFSCRTNPHSDLPVYTNIHRIRRDIVSVVEDYLTLEQLRDLKINVTVIRPLVDKFYELGDISIVYCLLVNRAQFLDEESRSSNRQNVNWTRATLCELIATRILRRFGEDNDGADGLLLLAHVLVAGFEPFQHAPAHVRDEVEDKAWWTSHRTLPALEVAILTESRHFLSSTTCQRVVAAIYEGRVIYTPSTSWDIIPDHYKLKPISLYDPRESPLLNQYRLIVPRTRNYLEAIQFTILLGLYVAVMVMRRKGELPYLEAAFAIYAFGWCLDQFATILAHGWNVYTQNLWSFLDVTFLFLFVIYSGLRLYAVRTGSPDLTEQAFDVLALAAPVIVPRLAFNWLSDNLVFLSLRSMMADFFLLTALSAWCFFGFLLSLLWLGQGAHPLLTISKWMIYIWFGLDGTGIHRSVEFHWLLGPVVMITFAFLGNTLFLTILVSMLSNTFSNISSNAAAEIHFRKAVLTLEGVKADAVFAYQPPFNLLAVFLLLPLKFVVSPRWFHKIHVATVRLVNLPLLLLIAVAERRLLWPAKTFDTGTVGSLAQKWFWQRWQLSAFQYIRAVFDVPPPDDVHDDIAVDDDLTHHLIRRQYARQETHDTTRKTSRRDSMFEVPPKLRGSLTETGEDVGDLVSRLVAMEQAMARMEGMLSRLLPREADEAGESDTLPEGDGTTLESNFKGRETSF